MNFTHAQHRRRMMRGVIVALATSGLCLCAHSADNALIGQCRKIAGFDESGAIDRAPQPNMSKDVSVCERAVAGSPADMDVLAFHAAALFQSGRKDAAMPRARRAALGGSVVGMLVLATMLDESNGASPADSVQKTHWYRMAAERGQSDAQVLLASILVAGNGGAMDDAQAVEWLRKAAEASNQWGQLILAQMLQAGRGVARNDSEAVVWLSKAAQQNYPRAQNALGMSFQLGKGVANDDAQAVDWYRKAASAGNAEGQLNLAAMFARGRGVAKDEVQAIAWYRKAAEQGLPQAQNALGVMVQDGRGVTSNDALAATWYQKAAKGGNDWGQYNLAEMLSSGRGIAKDEARAIEWYRKAAQQGLPQAQNALGVRYQDGRGVRKDDAQAFAWYQKAAEAGHDWGQYHLAEMLWSGRGVAKDEARAIIWYRKAAEQGLPKAQNVLGVMFQSGRGVSQDYAQAVEWYRKAAEAGNDWGQYNLAEMFWYGYGVAKDVVQATAWYRKAAQQGLAAAQNLLGVSFQDGVGVGKDNVQAAIWYRKAAVAGNADGQHNLAQLLSSANDPASDAEAVLWYRKAAEQGMAAAKYVLGMRYARGSGVPQDDAQAVALFRQAAAGGHEWAWFNLSRMLTLGRGTQKNEAEALTWLRKAAEGGVPPAQVALGIRLLNPPVASNVQEAASWIKKAAEAGDAGGQLYLGLLYSTGRGLPESAEQALLWFRRSAEQGEPIAQVEVAERLRHGRGAPADLAAARRWYQLAAASSNVEAQLRLGEMLYLGEGGVKEIAQAIDWLSKTLNDHTYGRGAADVLCDIGTPEAVLPVLEALRSSDGSVGAFEAALPDSFTLDELPNFVQSLENIPGSHRRQLALAFGRIRSVAAVPVLMKAIEDVSPDVRDAAGTALAGIDFPQLRTVLLDRIKHPSSPIRASAAEMLGKIGSNNVVPALVAALNDGDVKVRQAAVRSIALIQPEEANSALIAATLDADPDVRRLAARALGQIGLTDSAAPLIKAARDPAREVRLAAIEALGAVRAAEATGLIISYLDDRDEKMRSTAVEALGRIGAHSARPALVRALRDKDNAVRTAAADALVAVGIDTALPALLAVLKSGDATMRADVARLLGTLKTVSAIPALVVLAADVDPVCRTEAVKALALMESPDAHATLEQALSDPAVPVRMAASKALAKAGSQKALSTLLAALRQPDGRGRMEAAGVLGLVRFVDAVPELIQLMRTDINPLINGEAARALADIATPVAIRALIDAIEVSDLSDVVSTALVKIGSQEALTALQNALKSAQPDIAQHAAEALYSLGHGNGLTPVQLLHAQSAKDVRHDSFQQLTGAWQIAQMGQPERQNLTGLIGRTTTRMPAAGMEAVQAHLAKLPRAKDGASASDNPYLLALLVRWLIEAGEDGAALQQSTLALAKLTPFDRTLGVLLRWNRAEIYLLRRNGLLASQELLAIEQSILPDITTVERDRTGMLFSPRTLMLKARAELVGGRRQASVQHLFRAERELLRATQGSYSTVDDDDVRRLNHLIKSTRAKAQEESASADADGAIALGREIDLQGRFENEASEDAFSVSIQLALGKGAIELAHALTEELAARRAKWTSREPLISANSQRQASLSTLEALTKRVERAKSTLQGAQKGETMPGGPEQPPSAGKAVQGDNLSQLKRELVKAKSDVQQFLVNLKQSNPAVALLMGAKTTDLFQIQKHLAPDQVLLQYLVLEDASHAFILTHDRIQAVELPLGLSQLKDLVRAYRAVLQGKTVCMDSLRPPTQAGHCKTRTVDSGELSSRIAKALILPVEALLQGYQRLTIVPNGPLHELPFSALPLTKGLMAERFILNQLGSSSLMAVIGRPVAAERSTLVLAVPDAPGWPHLPSPALEVEAILRSFPGAEVKSDLAAVSGVVVGRDLQGRSLHFATHAIASSAQETRLALHDRDLHLADVWGLALDDSPRVVLSACETQVGERLSGDEVVSMANGFLFAGARSVVATLWPVDDRKTSAFMSRFYAELARGKPTPLALVLTQRQMQAEGEPASIWAAFIVTGQ